MGQNSVCIISPSCRRGFRGNPFYQADGFFTIRPGAFCGKVSDRHALRVRGQMPFGVESPFFLNLP